MDGWPLERRAALALDNRWPDYEAGEDALQYVRDRDEYYRNNPLIDLDVLRAGDLYQFTGTDAGPMS